MCTSARATSAGAGPQARDRSKGTERRAVVCAVLKRFFTRFLVVQSSRAVIPGMTNTPVCIPGPPVCIPASAHMGTPRMRRPRGTSADMTSAPRRRRPHIGGLAHGLAYITPLAGHRDRSALGQGRDAAGDSALLSDTVLLTLYVDRGPVIEPSFRVTILQRGGGWAFIQNGQ